MSDEKDVRKDEKTTKIMFGVLAFLGVMTLILGVLKIGQTIGPVTGDTSGAHGEIDLADNFVPLGTPSDIKKFEKD